MDCKAQPECANCADASKPVSRCGQCKGPAYCSKACQKKHWSDGHKRACKACAIDHEVIAGLKRSLAVFKNREVSRKHLAEHCLKDYEMMRKEYEAYLAEPFQTVFQERAMNCLKHEMAFKKRVADGEMGKALKQLEKYREATDAFLEFVMFEQGEEFRVCLVDPKLNENFPLKNDGAVQVCGLVWKLKREIMEEMASMLL